MMSLLFTLILSFALVLYNNKDIILILGYNYPTNVYIITATVMTIYSIVGAILSEPHTSESSGMNVMFTKINGKYRFIVC